MKIVSWRLSSTRSRGRCCRRTPPAGARRGGAFRRGPGCGRGPAGAAGVPLRPVGGEDVMVRVDAESVGDRDGEPLIAPGREWLTEVVALTLELKASAFNRQTDQRIRAALETLRAIQLHAGASVSISLHGELVALPA